jgi:hypothetical protein
LKSPADRFHGCKCPALTRRSRILRSQAGPGDVGSSALCSNSSVPSGETYITSTITGSAAGAMRVSSSSSRRVRFLRPDFHFIFTLRR